MKTPLKKLVMFIFFLFLNIHYSNGQWERDTKVPEHRTNIYQLPQEEFKALVEAGKILALYYPVTVSELLIPYAPMNTFFNQRPDDPARRLIYEMAKVASPFKSMSDLYHWLGLHEFPKNDQAANPYPLPRLINRNLDLPMGATIIETIHGEALTFGCAACHVGDLFGVKVLGLTNRFPRANEFFRMGEKYAPYINSFLFKDLLQTTEGERVLMLQAKKAVKWVGVKKPAALGLDTSLSQVALSLSKRKDDENASRTLSSRMFPRPNRLEKMVADSKPAVWWNVKYKNRWLSDGSIVSGNPVHTNFLWNEIGRGTDLIKLNQWMKNNDNKIKALTAAVFASQPPRYEKFFGIDSLNIPMAQRGEAHYVKSCQKCHGTYEKGWQNENADTFSPSQLVQTTKVRYHPKTPVIDVGTDPGRYLGMQAFAEDLNRLKISQELNAKVVPQKGYVPPPLDGIWARWPYFHNNSIPNLCVLLTASQNRPSSYFSGKAIDKNNDFDQECVGYPIGRKTPLAWRKNQEHFFNSTQEGLSNLGHDEGIFLKNGQEIFTLEEKRELIEFLKTL